MIGISTKGKIILCIVGLTLLLPTLYAQNTLIYDALLTGNSTLIHSTIRDNISLSMAMVSAFIAFILFIITIESHNQTNKTIELAMDANKNTAESIKLTQETLKLMQETQTLIENEMKKK